MFTTPARSTRSSPAAATNSGVVKRRAGLWDRLDRDEVDLVVLCADGVGQGQAAVVHLHVDRPCEPVGVAGGGAAEGELAFEVHLVDRVDGVGVAGRERHLIKTVRD